MLSYTPTPTHSCHDHCATCRLKRGLQSTPSKVCSHQDRFFVFVFVFLPSTSLCGVYSETFIHHYNVPLAHSFTHLCMTFFPTCTSCIMPLPLGSQCEQFSFLGFVTIKHQDRVVSWLNRSMFPALLCMFCLSSFISLFVCVRFLLLLCSFF